MDQEGASARRKKGKKAVGSNDPHQIDVATSPQPHPKLTLGGEGSSRRRKKNKEPIEANALQEQLPDADQACPYPSDYPRLYDYPFDKKFYMSTEMKEVKAKAKNLPVLNPIYPDHPTLEAYGLLEPVRSYFVGVGLDLVFYVHPGVHEKMVREFSYSFKPMQRLVKESESESGVVEKHIEAWIFQLGGRRWVLQRENLRQAYAVREECVKFPHCSDDIWSSFWREITGLDEDFAPSQAASMIKVPVWRMVHRLIATCVYLRPDGGRFVTNNDYILMCCMRAGVPIDPLIIITKAVSIPRISRGASLGGGHMITILALFLGFALHQGVPLPRKFLGEEELLRRGMLKQIRTPSGIKTVLVTEGPHTEKIKVPLSRTQTQDYSGPSHMPHASTGNDDLISMMRALTTFTQEGLRWQGDMMRNLHSQLDLSGFVEPPCYRPYTADYGHEGTSAGAHDTGADDMEDDENPAV